MNKHIREVMLDHQHAIDPSELIDIKIDSPYFGLGRIVGYCKECQLVKLEFREGATTVTESLYEVLGPDCDLDISDKALERRFGHLRELKAAKPSSVVSAGVAKKAARAVMEAKLRSPSKPTAKAKPEPEPKPISKLKLKLKSAPKNSSMVSSPDKPNVSASRRRVQEIARLGPPPGAKTLFGDRASK